MKITGALSSIFLKLFLSRVNSSGWVLTYDACTFAIPGLFKTSLYSSWKQPKPYSGSIGTSELCLGGSLCFWRCLTLACLKLVPLAKKNHGCDTNTARIWFETCKINFFLSYTSSLDKKHPISQKFTGEKFNFPMLIFQWMEDKLAFEYWLQTAP